MTKDKAEKLHSSLPELRSNSKAIQSYKKMDPPRIDGANSGDDGSVAVRLLDWYARNARVLPWRYPRGVRGDPYKIWLSEIMLQQTTVPVVGPYYDKFLTKWPTVQDLAQAPVEDVMHAWAGLGYYARARNLHACAKSVLNAHQGEFPNTIDGLLALPGIGPYTAAAVGAIAFGLPVVPVDGNVDRVVTRLHAIPDPVKIAKPRIKMLAQQIHDDAPDVDSGDLAQALMDLGATICTPKSPKCGLCPLREGCRAYKMGQPAQFPVPAQEKSKPLRYGYVYIARNGKNQVLLVRRPNKGLLAGMVALPTTDWTDRPQKRDPNPLKFKKASTIGEVRHSFTHFDLILKVVAGRITMADQPNGIWYSAGNLQDAGLPRVFAKAVTFIKGDGPKV